MKNKLFLGLLSMTFLFSSVSCGSKTSPTPKVEYTITYAGVEDAVNPNVTTYESGSDPIPLLDPIREGYPFEGWTYNGETVTKIDTSWASDITLVANWGNHYCHIEFEWDLPEQYRFYFLGEPFSTGFYLEGKYYELAPKVHLKYGEDGDVYIPYVNSISLHVRGFDSKTVGIKTVSVTVSDLFGPDGSPLYATTTYEVEVRDYDHDRYGYASQPQNVTNTFPDGYTLSAKAKNEEHVAAYNWVDTLEWLDPETHADCCSQQSYTPYNFLHGSTAFTNALEVPSSSDDDERFRLITIYDDLTRVYSDMATVITQLPTSEELENYARIGEYVFGPDDTRDGQPFDLAKYGIGSGTISFDKTEEGAEFTFTNVNFINNNYKCDAFNSSTGFDYFYVKGINEETDFGKYFIHLVGDNYFTNTYLVGGASGININFQNPRQSERQGLINFSTLTIDGSGTLNLVGGGPSLYANSCLIIKSKINISPYVGRNSSGIVANDILFTGESTFNCSSKGSAALAMLGNIKVEDGAKLDLNLVIPRKEGFAAEIFAIQAAGDVRFSSKHVNITISATPEIYQIYDNQTEGVDNVTIVSAGHNLVLESGANLDLRVLASDTLNLIPIFGMIYALAADVGVYIEDNSVLNINLQSHLFYGTFAIAANETIEIEHSIVNIDMVSKKVMNGIYCEEGNVAIIDSEVSINGHISGTEELPTFGVYSGQSAAIELIDSVLDIDLNRGIAVASFSTWQDTPAEYEEGYTPKQLSGFDLDSTKQSFGLYSVLAETETAGLGYIILETVFDLPFNNTPARSIHINNATI